MIAVINGSEPLVLDFSKTGNIWSIIVELSNILFNFNKAINPYFLT